MSNQVPPGPGQPPYPGSEPPPYGPYSSQAPGGPPPPPGSYPPGAPQDAPPPYGPPSYGPEPSYGPGYGPPSDPSYGPAPQPYGAPSDPSYGPPAGQDPAQAGYGGYQPGQGQYPQQQGGYVPSYAGGPYGGAPKGGSGGKVVAIVASAVVVVGLVVGGVFLLTRDKGDPVATSSSSSTKSTSTTKPKPTASKTTRSVSPGSIDPQTLAETAFPPAAGYEFTRCNEGSGEYNPVASARCGNTASEDYEVMVWKDVATARSSILGAYSAYQEVPWSGGTDYVWEATSGIFYDVVRCYADAPVCVEVFEDTQPEAEAALSHLTYLDGAGVASLNDWLTGAGI